MSPTSRSLWGPKASSLSSLLSPLPLPSLLWYFLLLSFFSWAYYRLAPLLPIPSLTPAPSSQGGNQFHSHFSTLRSLMQAKGPFWEYTHGAYLNKSSKTMLSSHHSSLCLSIFSKILENDKTQRIKPMVAQRNEDSSIFLRWTLPLRNSGWDYMGTA